MRDEFLNDICIDWIRTCAQLLMDGALSELEGAVQRFSLKTGLLYDDNLQVKYWIWRASKRYRACSRSSVFVSIRSNVLE